jgi:adenosylhomocysteinase
LPKIQNNDFKVADMSLADFGRREIELAEAEMPALMALRKKYDNLVKILHYFSNPHQK